MTTTPRRHPNVANLSELDAGTSEKGSRFGYAAKRLGQETGGSAIGCNWFEVPPGRTAFPCHYHCANEEALFVLEGNGTLRIGQDEVEVGPGDYVSFPVGPEHAHQLLNRGTAPLRYLCFSTMNKVEVVGYPDSNKLGAMAWEGPHKPAIVRALFPNDARVDYYDGEDVGE